ncbi:phosphate ABC transporter substrate-binding protein [Aestuariibacter halophilus]|uniref:Phosphate ABC transporter substrate-binding protein n=1 Tax=Fluctibacter halophilus TaxID=226011 RepID=A0ABS8G7H0_9ALTE|nr:phosphate ABC transporter substrate-binding protein [Aestuariibacter halophilus]MCC2615181.1 phosphate ABC transporter substrate-binding protein [Aestuariibacter halophilus]
MKTLLVMMACLLCASPAFAGYVVIVNAGNGAEVSMSDVKKIYLGKKGAFSNGENAIPITLSEGDAVRGQFNDGVLNKNEGQYVAYWSKMVFTGNGVPPREVATMQEVKDLVAKNPSTIGFIDESLVDGSVKVVGSF